mmetsp:Transcript_10054/g.14211  ORF Transcript_10054/g.14211 Transcript_10054/m.14211 type:complete len:234 (+) Transcript_10054:61-762(+)|eukprot:CAMPEP_0184865594 /NCGR_PEP_ID=MMETSP0580-20130426/18589_1 /TAXON_ID=1118495 /ORGANISM="Dactyliosolen fragilissimus" /LENGTH=233 /DNA_ID=CAMNT_0027364867 /DNA_START=40 /DNA_END=741 /DNA_ORIENTATION=+
MLGRKSIHIRGINIIRLFILLVPVPNILQVHSYSICASRTSIGKIDRCETYALRNSSTNSLRLSTKDDNEDLDGDDDEDVDPGELRVSEIKSELKLRNIDFSDCFDKESLATKLRDARAKGKSDPTIIDQFNRQHIEKNFKGEEEDVNFIQNDEIVNQAVGGDGTLPGGMPPDMLKSLVGNPEIMALMQNPKMQDVMKLMMSGGQGALEKAMQEDQEVYEIVTKLNSIMKGAL